jgi:GNAT superfamily N-acetyltransferase
MTEDLEYRAKQRVRLGRIEEIPVYVEMGRQFFEMTQFRAYTYNAPQAAAFARSIIEDRRGNSRIFVADDRAGKPVGLLIGGAQKMLFTNDLVGSIQVFAVLPGHASERAGLRLFRTFLKWALDQGVKSVNFGVTSGDNIDKLDRFVTRFGFRRVGGHYTLSAAETNLPRAT